MTFKTRRRVLGAIVPGFVATLLASCSELKLFNALTLKDSASERVASAVKYGADPRQAYDVYAPVVRNTPLPVVVFFYGGGWNSGDRRDYSWAGRALAALGYITVLPDYRLVPDVRYPVFLEDCAAALHHIHANICAHGGDASRMAVTGHSAGAYNAVMMVLDQRYTGHGSGGAVPVKAVAGISGPYDFYPFVVKESQDAFGSWPEPPETQPVNHAHATQTKFLLLHSRADTLVEIKNPVNLAARLKAAGADVTLKLYDKASHQDMVAALSIPFRWKVPVLDDLRTFLARTL